MHIFGTSAVSVSVLLTILWHTYNSCRYLVQKKRTRQRILKFNSNLILRFNKSQSSSPEWLTRISLIDKPTILGFHIPTKKSYLSTIKMTAPISMNAACSRNGTRKGLSGMFCEARPANGGNMARPIVPKANCRPTSPRPMDVSRVAMTQAVPRRANAAVGHMSDNILKKM